MSSDTITRVKDKFVTVDGLNTRYIEEALKKQPAPTFFAPRAA